MSVLDERVLDETIAMVLMTSERGREGEVRGYKFWGTRQ